jgi:diguanylate cyclase (GGDEF)-like protein/PAS domain S-box-containing protein
MTIELMERFAGMAALAIERARMHKRVADSAQLFHRTFEDAPLGMALLTLDGRIEQTNGMYAQMVRRERSELPGLLCWDLVHEQDREAVRLGVLLVADGTLPLVSGDMRDVSGQAWGAATASRLDGPNGPRLLVQMLDVTDQRRATAALRQQAVTDPLTGLRNRAGLAHHLKGMLAEQERSGAGSRVAVLFCDVDRFKLVNDTYGHAAGDELIVHVASALTTELRGSDAAARLGGDEFVVVLADCDGPAGAVAAAERLRGAVCRPVTVGPVTLTPSLSIGIALSEPGSEPDLLLGDADSALYRAKDAGRGRWELFAPQMRDENVARLRLREDLRHAVCGHQLRLHYQPLVELATGRTCGYEALLRWQHPQRGLLAPAAFLEELMHGDLADAATDWVVEQALADAATWPAHDGVAPYVSVNVSPDQLARPDLPGAILSALKRHGVQEDRLWVEVTEEAVVSDDVQLSALAVLREAGVHVALDDFGSGYAGLLALRHVPADVVKLDRAFTVDLLKDATTMAIVDAVVRLCGALGKRLVAEGLETAEHVQAVRALGITHGQGWHLGRPQALVTGAGAATAGQPGGDLAGELRRVDAALAGAGDGRRCRGSRCSTGG